MFIAKYRFDCGRCGEVHPAGTEARYETDSSTVSAIECMETYEAPTGGSAPTYRPDTIMPRGKTVRDRCSRCFLVHTAAQGDECE